MPTMDTFMDGLEARDAQELVDGRTTDGPVVVPASFPRGNLASLSVAQPRYAAKAMTGEVVAGLSDEEVHQRYAVCADLVWQVEPLGRKMLTTQEIDLQTMLGLIRCTAVRRAWKVSVDELDWILDQVEAALRHR